MELASISAGAFNVGEMAFMPHGNTPPPHVCLFAQRKSGRAVFAANSKAPNPKNGPEFGWALESAQLETAEAEAAFSSFGCRELM